MIEKSRFLTTLKKKLESMEKLKSHKRQHVLYLAETEKQQKNIKKILNCINENFTSLTVLMKNVQSLCWKLFLKLTKVNIEFFLLII